MDFEALGASPEVAAKLKEAYEAEISSKYKPVEEFEKVLKNKDELLAEKKAEQERRREAEAIAEAEKLERAKKNNDLESLENSYKAQLAERDSRLAEIENQNKRASIGRIADQFVSSNVIDDPFVRESMAEKFAARLDVREGKTVVLDPDGNLTALSVDNLIAEFKTATKYAKHMIGTKASGGGATGSNGFSSGELKAGTPEARKAKIAARLAQHGIN